MNIKQQCEQASILTPDDFSAADQSTLRSMVSAARHAGAVDTSVSVGSISRGKTTRYEGVHDGARFVVTEERALGASDRVTGMSLTFGGGQIIRLGRLF